MPLVTNKCANFTQLLLLSSVLLHGKDRCTAPNTTTASKLKGFDAVAFFCLSLEYVGTIDLSYVRAKKKGDYRDIYGAYGGGVWLSS